MNMSAIVFAMSAMVAAQSPQMPQTPPEQFVLVDGSGQGAAPAETGSDATQEAQPALVAEPQTPSGKFTTATEVRPILGATRADWVAVRDWEGQDLVFVTHIWSWRCGLVALRVAVNDGLAVDWPLPACHSQTATPNAITQEDGLPYRVFPQGTVQSLTVTLVYDDLGEETVSFDRAAVLMP